MPSPQEHPGGSAKARELRARYLVARLDAIREITEAINLAGGNVSHAARLLGIGRRTMLRYLQDPAIAAATKRIRDEAAKRGESQ